MTAVLKLVAKPVIVKTGKRAKVQVAAARPYKTYYYEDLRGGSHGRVGSSVTERGAIRAAVVRLFDEQFQRAEIYEADVLIHTVRRKDSGISISYGRS